MRTAQSIVILVFVKYGSHQIADVIIKRRRRRSKMFMLLESVIFSYLECTIIHSFIISYFCGCSFQLGTLNKLVYMVIRYAKPNRAHSIHRFEPFYRATTSEIAKKPSVPYIVSTVADIFLPVEQMVLFCYFRVGHFMSQKYFLL